MAEADRGSFIYWLKHTEVALYWPKQTDVALYTG